MGKGREKMQILDNRLVERGRGCWNCIHSSHEKAMDLWWNKARGAQLERAVQITLDPNNKAGEQDPRVINIRRSVPDLDEKITAGAFLVCEKGKSGADFTAATFLCDHWTGKQGSSLATSGHKLDDLPGELMDKRGDGNESPSASIPGVLPQIPGLPDPKDN